MREHEAKPVNISDLESEARRNMGSSPHADPFEYLLEAIAKRCAASPSHSISLIYRAQARLLVSIYPNTEKSFEELFPSLYFCECRKCYTRLRKSHAIWHDGSPYCEKHAREEFE